MKPLTEKTFLTTILWKLQNETQLKLEEMIAQLTNHQQTLTSHEQLSTANQWKLTQHNESYRYTNMKSNVNSFILSNMCYTSY